MNNEWWSTTFPSMVYSKTAASNLSSPTFPLPYQSHRSLERTPVVLAIVGRFSHLVYYSGAQVEVNTLNLPKTRYHHVTRSAVPDHLMVLVHPGAIRTYLHPSEKITENAGEFVGSPRARFYLLLGIA